MATTNINLTTKGKLFQFVTAIWAFLRGKRYVLLSGKKDSGKSSLLKVLIGEKVVDGEGDDSVKAVKPALDIKINKMNYLFYDTNGGGDANEEKEKLKDGFEHKKYKDKVADFYLFDASKYDERERTAIAAFKKAREFKMAVIGTHRDKITTERKEVIEREVSEEIKLPCKIFDFTQSPKAELEKFICEAIQW